MMNTENPETKPAGVPVGNLQTSIDLFVQLAVQNQANLEVIQNLLQVYIESNKSLLAMGEQIRQALVEAENRQHRPDDVIPL